MVSAVLRSGVIAAASVLEKDLMRQILSGDGLGDRDRGAARRGWLAALLLLGAVGCAGAGHVPAEEVRMSSGRLTPCPASPNCVSSQAADDAHSIEPLRISGDAARALQDLRRIIEAMPRVRIVRATDTELHAEFTSRLFRFVDDVDCLLDAPAGVIHIRSASRTGYSDLGVNRRRVEAIRAAFAGRDQRR
jgi:uncharacterized protein (DUF1499 family)